MVNKIYFRLFIRTISYGYRGQKLRINHRVSYFIILYIYKEQNVKNIKAKIGEIFKITQQN